MAVMLAGRYNFPDTPTCCDSMLGSRRQGNEINLASKDPKELPLMTTADQSAACVQDAKFSAQVASLESEVKTLKASNASLGKDNKACYSQIRAKDKQLDSAAKEVEHARQTKLHNKVRCDVVDLLSVCT